MKKMTLAIAVLALVAVSVPVAEVSASNNYYYPNSTYQYQYQYLPSAVPSYGYNGVMNQDQLANYLRVLIVQLQSQIASRPSYDYYGGAYGYKYNYVVGGPRGYYDDEDDYDDDQPDVETLSAEDINENDARLRGEVDMNDADDGEVFFVYGTDRDDVEDVEGDYDTYSEIDTRGEALKKTMVDSSFDGNDDFEQRVSGLDEDEQYYFSICVGYEDEDDDDTLICGSVRSFETDN